MTYNAALAGLVGITAGCDAVSPLGAAIMGIVFGIVIVLAVEFFDKVAKIDDPVGAISVHGICGALGTVFTGLFATGISTEKGLFYGGGFHFLGVQALGVVSVIIYVAVVMTIVFFVIKKTIGLRVDAEDEIAGLDVSEHGLLTAYSGFAMLPESVPSGNGEPIVVSGNVPEAEAVPVRKMLRTAIPMASLRQSVWPMPMLDPSRKSHFCIVRFLKNITPARARWSLTFGCRTNPGRAAM